MKKTRNGKRLHLVALLVGVYAVFLGFGLVLAELGHAGEAIGSIRLLFGLGMTGFGLFGVWDGVRDIIRPPAKRDRKSPTQYILTDVSGNRTSNVTAETIRDEMGKLRAEERNSFHLQLLTPRDVSEWGALKQISCTAQPSLTLLAFFQTPEGGWKVCTRAMDPEAAADWFRRLLEDSFSDWDGDWETLEEVPGEARETGEPEDQELGVRVLRDQAGVYTVWHRRLVIVGNAWRNEHKFFTVRDVELAAQGVLEGEYQYAALEWGSSSFSLIPGQGERLQVIWCTNVWSDEARRFFRKEGTVFQVISWLVQYMNEGTMDEPWDETTAPAERRNQHG